MYDATVLASAALAIAAGCDYVRRAWIRETHPVPATWILMLVMFGLQFWMYWESPYRSWTANIGVTAGGTNILIIFLGVIAANIRFGTLSIAFDRTQRWCLTAGAGVVVFWSITDQPLLSYVLVQCIALVAYFATVKRLWNAPSSTEPALFWWAILLASLCALYPAWAKHDPFSWIYLSRVVPSTVLVIFLIRRTKGKQG
ncbi:MAG TPA: hypothetical protein VJC16_00765 [Candidatus Nanoarchaeia archaeon]|nr:hypothetical protein [Candidatus Nanoarchaeia archaeon]